MIDLETFPYSRSVRWVWELPKMRREEVVIMLAKDFDDLIEEVKDLREKLTVANNNYHKIRRKHMRYG